MVQFLEYAILYFASCWYTYMLSFHESIKYLIPYYSEVDKFND